MLEILNKHWRKLITVLVVLLLMVGEAILLTTDHWLTRVRGATVAYNGQPSNASRVYQRQDGKLLVQVQEDTGPSFYLVDPVRRIVGIASPTRFVFLPGGYVYGRDVPASYTLMKSAKIEVDPQLVIEPGAVEFNSFEKRRVRLTL